MISNERDILPIGYGAMLVEGFVGLMALVAACVVADAAIMLPVALWLAVAALFMAVRWSRSLPLLEPAPQAEPVVPEGPAASPASVPG